MKLEHGTAEKGNLCHGHTNLRVTHSSSLRAEGLITGSSSTVVLLVIRRFNARNCALCCLQAQQVFWISAQTSLFPGIALLLSLPISSGTQGIPIIPSTHIIYSSVLFVLHCQRLLFRHPSQKYKITRFNKPPGAIKKLS